MRTRLCSAVACIALVLGTVFAVPATAAKPAPSKQAAAAARVLMNSYDPKTAYWDSSWWNSAVATTTVIDYMRETGDLQYLPQVEHTFVKDQKPYPAGTLSGDPIEGDFISRAIDDTEWWGLAWVDAYDLTGQQKYLKMATKIGNYVASYWDPSTCGGGVWWNTDKTYKNAITNGLYVRLAASLADRTHRKTWLARASTAWNWYLHSGLIGPNNLVNDGLTDDCTNNGQTVWTYNQGLAIGGAVEVWRATGDKSALAEAKVLADAAVTSTTLNTDGVLTESCDPVTVPGCDDNQKQFKGIFMRYLGDLNTVAHGRYSQYINAQIASLQTNDSNVHHEYGINWHGWATSDHPNTRDWRTQASALEALLARPALARAGATANRQR